MNDHLTEKELIEYKFDLAGEAEMKRYAKHLETCRQCSGDLEKLSARFAALDLLKGQVTVSDELLSRTASLAAQPVKKRISYKFPAWLGAAAAVIVIGSLLLFSQINKTERKKEIAKEPSVGLLEKDKREIPLASYYSEKAVSKDADASAGGIAGVSGTAVADKAVPEKPPFAPASAIELNVLPQRDKVQITIYNSADLTLVRETRKLTLKKGWNWLQFMWANTLIDPTSLSIEPKAQADKIRIEQLVFPPRLKELGRWLIRSEIDGLVPFEITYFTSGLNWRAFYMGTLSADETKMEMKGYVRVDNNSGEDYENAQTRLIVGKVHQLDLIADLARRQYPYGSPIPLQAGQVENNLRYLGDDKSGLIEKYSFGLAGRGGMLFDGPAKPKEIVKEGLSEYFLYTIEGTETIPNQWAKRLISFDVSGIDVNSLYKYDEERWGRQTIRFVSFKNDDKHNLGQTPIPDGSVKIFSRTADNKGLAYVGGTDIKYIPVNEKAELELGPARLVKVEPKLMEYKTDNYIYNDKGNIVGWDEIRTWKIELTNTRTLPVDLEITRGFDTPYWSITMQPDQYPVEYNKHDATHARFKTKLELGTKHSFSYMLTTVHGKRQQVAETREPNFMEPDVISEELKRIKK